MRHALIFLALLLPAPLVLAQQPAPPLDQRQLVAMPKLPRALMRTDMQDHLVALNEIFVYLAENNLAAAAETAEKRLGNSSMGKHAMMARSQGPGRFMPDAMRQMGWDMHAAASGFAQVAKEGDTAKTYAAAESHG